MRNSSAYFLIIVTASKRVMLKCPTRIEISWLVWCWHRTKYSRRSNPGARSTSWSFQTRTWGSNIRKCGKHRTYPIQVELHADSPPVHVSVGNITLTPSKFNIKLESGCLRKCRKHHTYSKTNVAYFSHWVRETSHSCSRALPLYFHNLNSIQMTHDI